MTLSAENETVIAQAIAGLMSPYQQAAKLAIHSAINAQEGQWLCVRTPEIEALAQRRGNQFEVFVLPASGHRAFFTLL